MDRRIFSVVSKILLCVREWWKWQGESEVGEEEERRRGREEGEEKV